MLDAPSTFINSAPHMTFVRGEKDVAFLKKRYEALKEQPLFAGIEYSEDSRVINTWAPLLMQKRRKGEPFAATRVPAGTDVDFGALTRQLFDDLARATAPRSRTNTRGAAGSSGSTTAPGASSAADSIGRTPGEIRRAVRLRRRRRLGAQAAAALRHPRDHGLRRLPDRRAVPARPRNPALVAQHKAKVYSQASVGAPPMSVPHLDTRVVDGEASLLFGPFATFSPKFLKNGSIFDLVAQVRPGNLGPMIKVAIDNPSLITYLVGELLKNHAKKVDSLRTFMPTAKDEDWELHPPPASARRS